MSQCRSCNATIFWGSTTRGKPAPFDPDGQSHFATCPDSRAWRREPEPEPEREPERQAELFDAASAPPARRRGYWEA